MSDTRSDKYKLPKLPEGQRWLITSSFNTFLEVKLQRKGRWFWHTIASSSEYLSLGDRAVAICVDHILRRDEIERAEAAVRVRRQQSFNRIPFGPSK